MQDTTKKQIIKKIDDKELESLKKSIHDYEFEMDKILNGPFSLDSYNEYQRYKFTRDLLCARYNEETENKENDKKSNS